MEHLNHINITNIKERLFHGFFVVLILVVSISWKTGSTINTIKNNTLLTDTVLWQANWIGEGTGKDPINGKNFYDLVVTVDSEGDSLHYQPNSLLLRKECRFLKPVSKATVYVCGLGLYELTINGERIGDKVLNPAKTNYNKIILYDTYDVSEKIKSEKCILGIMLGNGWYNPIPKWWSWRMQWFGEKRAILQMHVTFIDGTTQIITTDDTWKIAEGPVRSHCIYDGEIYDATKEYTGWDKPGFSDLTWNSAKIVNPPHGKLVAQIIPAIKCIEKLSPVSVTYPNDSVSLVNFGRNFSGWVRIRLKGNKGDHIVLRYAEDSNNGMLDPASNHLALAKDVYISRGDNKEVYEPRFTYHGFQYVEISGLKYKLLSEDIEGIVVHSAVEPTGTFECSNEQINKIHKAVIWSQSANLMGYPTDCPQREERLGWTGDAHVTAEEAIYNFNMDLFYIKWLNDLKVNQYSNGEIPFIAPRPPIPEDPAVSWSCGYLLITWYHYLYYGDVNILADHYESMKRYVDFLSSMANSYILPKDRYGDWNSSSGEWTPGMPLSTSTAYYFYVTTIMSKVSQILGFNKDAVTYQVLAENIKNAFNRNFYNTEKKQYEDGSQFANSFALFLKLVPQSEEQAVLNNLINDIINTNKGHLNTGILGTKYLMELLSEKGRSDIAWLLATQKTYPSWINMLETRTTLSEHWGDGGMNSHNHVMFGSIDSWFYKTLGGIKIDENNPGFGVVIIKPYMPADLEWVKSSVKTVHGLVRSEWIQNQSEYTLNIQIPDGTEAVVYVLAKCSKKIKVGKLPVRKVKGVTLLRMENNYAVLRVEPGKYNFISYNP
jgi:alpha-L-rhamnosidase